MSSFIYSHSYLMSANEKRYHKNGSLATHTCISSFSQEVIFPDPQPLCTVAYWILLSSTLYNRIFLTAWSQTSMYMLSVFHHPSDIFVQYFTMPHSIRVYIMGPKGLLAYNGGWVGVPSFLCSLSDLFRHACWTCNKYRQGSYHQ